ncbi:hypothetical protein [Polluticaenibacter yanchengensis]|uniref:Uncharacterized protein n=1 Tax=Polluticaenibacter yanchengensis TaxID=3014562 RepID=A0ABT4ULC0_9BACT|nr:hypothetical protein [Chitinophagaceae bacterium LY-5]
MRLAELRRVRGADNLFNSSNAVAGSDTTMFNSSRSGGSIKKEIFKFETTGYN